MGNEIVYVVGDKYIEFTKNSGAITITNAIQIANIFLSNLKKRKFTELDKELALKKQTNLIL
jgi:hypothetical protein